MNIWTGLFIFFSVLSPIPYIKSILSGLTKPHQTTRIIVWVASLASIIVSLNSDNFTAKIFGAVFFARASLLLALALKYGVGGKSRIGIVCLILGVTGLVVARFYSGIIGIILVVISDLIGYLPAFVKTYYCPKTEEPKFYIFESLAAMCVMIGIGKIAITQILPAYFVFTSVVMLGLIYRPVLTDKKGIK